MQKENRVLVMPMHAAMLLNHAQAEELAWQADFRMHKHRVQHMSGCLAIERTQTWHQPRLFLRSTTGSAPVTVVTGTSSWQYYHRDRSSTKGTRLPREMDFKRVRAGVSPANSMPVWAHHLACKCSIRSRWSQMLRNTFSCMRTWWL